MKRRLCDLDRGTLFRTADGLLWRPGYPAAGASRWAHAVGRPQDSRGLPADTEVEVVDPAAVLARAAELERENAELRAVLHDLWQDRDGAAVGAAVERGAVLEVLAAANAAPHDFVDLAVSRILARVAAEVHSRGPWRPPAPPCALEGAVQEAVGLLTEAGVSVPGRGVMGYGWAKVEAALARLRAALGEG